MLSSVSCHSQSFYSLGKLWRFLQSSAKAASQVPGIRGIANNCSLSEGPLAAKTYNKMECQQDAGGGSTPPTSTGPMCFRQAALVLIMATVRLLLVLSRAGGFPKLFH